MNESDRVRPMSSRTTTSTSQNARASCFSVIGFVIVKTGNCQFNNAFSAMIEE